MEDKRLVVYSYVNQEKEIPTSLMYSMIEVSPQEGKACYEIEIHQKGGLGEERASGRVCCEKEAAVDLLQTLARETALPLTLEYILEDWRR